MTQINADYIGATQESEHPPISNLDLEGLKAEVTRLERAVQGVADLSNRRRLEIQIERIQNLLLDRVTETNEIRANLQVEVRKQIALFEAVSGNIPMGITVAEAPSGKVVYTNAYLHKLLKEPPLQTDNLSQYDQFGNFHRDGRPYTADEYPIARAITLGETVMNEEINYRCGDGEVRRLIAHAIPIKDDNGNVIAAVGIVFDSAVVNP